MSRCTDELGTVQPSRAEVAKFWNVAPDNHNTVPGRRQYRFNRGGWPAMGAFTMANGRLLLACDDPGCLPDWVGTVAHLRRGKNSDGGRNPCLGYRIGPTGKELPPGRGTAKEGARSTRRRGARAATGKTGSGGKAPTLIRAKAPPPSPASRVPWTW